MSQPRVVKRSDELSGLDPEMQRMIRSYVDRRVREELENVRSQDRKADEDLRNALQGAAAALKRRHSTRT